MKYALKGKNIKFINRQIDSTKANDLFLELKGALALKNDEKIELYLTQFTNTLEKYSQENKTDYMGLNFNSYHQINSYIEDHIYDKLSLEDLAQIVHINKFGFAKKFKALTGMTPMNYVLMRKIFSSKALIKSNLELTEIAYQYNFTDMAHFSKTFKRFIGISPSKYKESLSTKMK
jgi:AraC-like DNA-binding protein